MGTETKRKILVIENQQTQFLKILEGLHNFEVYPKDTNYVHFIDHVRIWVNERYSDSYRASAFDYIQNCIEQFQIDLILMDHILGGAHHCLDGIKLATDVNNELYSKGLDILPVVFLSKTEHTRKSKIMGFESYEQAYPSMTQWVHKGYFGEEILDLEYFESYVVKAINMCLPQTEERQFWERYDSLLKLSYSENQKTKLLELTKIRQTKNYSALSSTFKIAIENFYKDKNYSTLNLNMLKDETAH